MHIFEYDGTYREIMDNVIYGDEMKYKLWDLWKKTLFMCKKFNDNVFLKKMEYILDYHFYRIGREFPENIQIYCGYKLFYYSEKKENNRQAFQTFLDRNFTFSRNEIEICFMYSDGKNISTKGQVFTKKQYYETFVYIYEDVYPELICLDNNRELYLLQHYTEIAHLL